MGGQRHAPTAFPGDADPVPTVQEAGWAPGPVRSGKKNLGPIAIFFLCTSSLLFLCPDWSSCPYCTTHTTQTSMSQAGFEPAIPAGERLQTRALDRSATGIGTDPRTLKLVVSRYTD